MFAPLIHGQNRGGYQPPVNNEVYQWWNAEDGNYIVDDTAQPNANNSKFINLAENLPSPPPGNDYNFIVNRPNYAYTGGVNSFDFYGDTMYHESNDASFGGRNSFLMSDNPSQINTGNFKTNTMKIITSPVPLLYNDATLFLAIEYYPYIGMDQRTLWSWQTENGDEFDLFEYVMDYDGFYLKKFRREVTGWKTEFTAGSFPHPVDPSLNTNKFIIALTSRAAYINGIEVMNAYSGAPLSSTEQIRLNQFTSLFNTANIYKVGSVDEPLSDTFSIGKFSEGLFYSRILSPVEISDTSFWLANRNGINF
jgi:hypothetical protein